MKIILQGKNKGIEITVEIYEENEELTRKEVIEAQKLFGVELLKATKSFESK